MQWQTETVNNRMALLGLMIQFAIFSLFADWPVMTMFASIYLLLKLLSALVLLPFIFRLLHTAHFGICDSL